MSRYIDAEHFDERVRIAGGMSEDELTEDFKDGVLATLALLETEPTADVVEVVRCKDCIHHKPFPFSDEHICDVFDWESEDKDFCSFAERRNDG